MVHNGIEYGIMASYAEGLNILRHANAGKQKQTVDAETTPLRHPELYQYDLNLADIAEVWRRGSVISSWLLDLAAISLWIAQIWPSLPGAFQTQERDGGPSRPPLTSLFPRLFSAPLCTRVSARAVRMSSLTSCCRHYATSSAAMRRSPRLEREANDG